MSTCTDWPGERTYPLTHAVVSADTVTWTFAYGESFTLEG